MYADYTRLSLYGIISVLSSKTQLSETKCKTILLMKWETKNIAHCLNNKAKIRWSNLTKVGKGNEMEEIADPIEMKDKGHSS